MYGNETLNNHEALKYSLTKEFFETFSTLTYQNIELPVVLIRYFHVFIREHVDENLNNESYVSTMKKKHRLFTMKDVQQSLARNPKVERNLSVVPHRNMILMPGRMVAFAMKQLSKLNILLIIANKEDQKALNDVTLPKNMQVFDFYHHFKKEQVAKRNFSITQQKAIKIISSKNTVNPIFKTESFRKWLNKYIIVGIHFISLLERVVRRYPIKVMIDQVEIVNPGTTLSLLSKKFNLPFINIPQVLISDRSLIPTRASHYCVWGKNYKNWLEKRGIPSAIVYETGNINFEYKTLKNPSKENFHKTFNIPSHHKVIAFTTQPFAESVNITIVDWIKKALKPSLPITLIICPHPSDKTDYNHLINNQHNLIVTSQKDSLYNILGHVDAVVTISSTTSIEAALLGKGILIMQPPIPYQYDIHNNNFNSHLVRAGAGPVINNQSQLSTILMKMTNEPAYLNELSNQSQTFLSQTINSQGRPSVLIRRIIVKALNEVRK
ncbi:hypothetical protein [Alteribacter populi]|uniref:hypothetical protein n=1 Tax=Alteribacter populi TaxID=2011011 RepID=UPI000BBA452F|nr:hypothetical protein [Alteribacter populi]